MKDIVKFLKENPVQYLSTVGPDGLPQVRPFQFMLEQDGRLYFCTSTQKEVYQSLQTHPYCELCTSSPSFAWIRVAGKAVFCDDPAIKAQILAQSPLVKSIYHTADNPIFTLFYLEHGRAMIGDFSGNPPRIFAF